MINKRRTHSTPIISKASSTTSNIKETIVTGFGLGVGNEISHRAVSTVLGPRSIEVQYSSKCQEFIDKYKKCSEKDTCVNELEEYKSCVKNL